MITKSEVIKTQEVVIKMVFLYQRKGKFSQNSANWQQKTRVFATILKIHPYKRKIVFEKLNHVCFVTWAVTNNPKIQVWGKSLACTNMEQVNFCCSLLVICAENQNYVTGNWGISKNLEKSKKKNKNCHSELFKNQRCFRGNQRCSEIFRKWTALKQTWKYSESELISAEWLWDVNPGCNETFWISVNTLPEHAFMWTLIYHLGWKCGFLGESGIKRHQGYVSTGSGVSLEPEIPV